MADIVLGVGTSHSPQVTVPWQSWSLLRGKDETDPRLDYAGLLQRARPGLEDELTESVWHARYSATQQALRGLGKALEVSRPDVAVVFGDDQHEQFLDDNMPAIAIFHGDEFPLLQNPRNPSPYKSIEQKEWAPTEATYPGSPTLANHLLDSLALDEFDVARTNRLRDDVGIGHAFAFVYRRLWPGTSVPMVPVMVNTYYPPNQPTPRRCYALGRAVRRAIESWDVSARVAVIASGGLSHTIMDEELDRAFLEALTTNDIDRLFAIPRGKLKGGTSEILNWIAVAGAMEGTPFTLVDYLPGYRSPAGTGCGMGFACWSPVASSITADEVERLVVR